MSSSRQTLERIGSRVPVPQPAFDRMMRRRDRRNRNRRIGSAVLALLLAALAIGGAIRVIGGAERQLPANPGLDNSFGSRGVVTTSISDQKDEVHAIAIQPDGKIVVAGSSGDDAEFALARYNTDGTLDTTFGVAGTVTTDFTSGKDVSFGLAIQANGKLVAAGSAGDASFALARYNPDGTLDPTFGNGGTVMTNFTQQGDFARDVAIQPDGKIVAVGPSSGGGAADFALARYNPDGTLDSTFGSGGTVTTNFKNRDDPYGIAIQPNGKIVAAGFGAGSFALARYDADGTLDATFGKSGTVLTDLPGGASAAFQIALQPDGKVVASGGSAFDSTPTFTLARYKRNGRLDDAFGTTGTSTSGAVDAFADLAIQPDGKILAAGSNFTLARFDADGTLDATFGSSGELTADFGSGFVSTGADAIAIQADGKILAAGSASVSKTDSDLALVRYLTKTGTAPAASSSSAPNIAFYVGLAAIIGILLLVRARRRGL